MSVSIYSYEYYRKKMDEAKRIANEQNKTLAVGCCDYAGYTIVDASDEYAVAELGDVGFVYPDSKEKNDLH